MIRFLIFIFFFSIKALAADKNFTPRFVSLKPSEVNLRVGPGQNYPTDWVYFKAGIPLEVIAEFDVWRKVRDIDGTEGWVHQSMLCKKRHALIRLPEALLYNAALPKGSPIARLQKGVLVELLKCSDDWCQVRVQDLKGWVKREVLWGLYPKEKIG